MKKKEEKGVSLDEINASIRKGDHRLISEIVGCTSDYVAMVLRGDRKSERIISVANELINNREALIARLKK